MSADGTDWVTVHESVRLAIEPVLGTGGAMAKAGLTVDDVPPEPGPSLRTDLDSPWPNPANPSTNVSFSLATPSHVEITIYNPRGQKVRTLLAAWKGRGRHGLTWSGTDDRGVPVGSGVYLLQLRTPEMTVMRRTVLLQ